MSISRISSSLGEHEVHVTGFPMCDEDWLDFIEMSNFNNKDGTKTYWATELNLCGYTLADGFTLDIEYFSQKGEMTTRRIDIVDYYDDIKQIKAFCHSSNDHRHFSISGIKSAKFVSSEYDLCNYCHIHERT